MSRLRIRFSFNQQTGQRGPGEKLQGFDKFARVIVHQVAVSYGENMLKVLKDRIETQVKADIRRELEFTAKLFMTHVIGIPGRNLGPTGTLKTVAPLSSAMEGLPFMQVGVRQLAPEWQRRSSDYLAWRSKPKNGGSTNWFKLKGSVLGKMGSEGEWLAAFGPIAVSLSPGEELNLKEAPKQNQLTTGYGTGEKLIIGKLRVTAMNRITPEMLPALGGGALGDFGDNPQGSGLLNLLGKDAANRLGGNPARVPFRATIQPFLSFFLTRQLPNAVARRIEQGFQKGRWDRMAAEHSGSAGRSI